MTSSCAIERVCSSRTCAFVEIHVSPRAREELTPPHTSGIFPIVAGLR